METDGRQLELPPRSRSEVAPPRPPPLGSLPAGGRFRSMPVGGGGFLLPPAKDVELPQLARLSSRQRFQLQDCGCPPGQSREKHLEALVEYGDRQNRRRATSSLLLGSIFGFLGFLTAAFLGMYRYWFVGYQDLNLQGKPFPSGKTYWPGSVSEMVNDPRTPSGKCWLAFETIAALAIWTSWYPWELRNVYVGGGVKLCGCCMPFLTARVFVPPIGMLMVVMISISSPGEDDFGDTFASYIHLSGAVLMLGGHGIFELFTLCCSEVVRMHRRERVLRWIFCVACLVNGFLFFLFGKMNSYKTVCCADERRIPTDADIAEARANGHPGIAMRDEAAMDAGDLLLYNTATGKYRLFKYLCFWCEVLAGFNMIGGLLTIWWYCPERHLDLHNELPGEYPREDSEDDAGDSSGDDGATDGMALPR